MYETVKRSNMNVIRKKKKEWDRSNILKTSLVNRKCV